LNIVLILTVHDFALAVAKDGCLILALGEAQRIEVSNWRERSWQTIRKLKISRKTIENFD
jgi:hypothetical protein